MPYLAFDLNAMARAENAARALGVADTIIKGGLLNLWAHCFRETTDRVTGHQVVAFFGLAEVVEHLVAFGFLAPLENSFRVKGADRYLRLKAGLRRGAEKTNALRRRSKASEFDALERLKATLPDALSASSEQRAATTNKDLARKKPRAAKPAVTPDPRHAPLVKALCAAAGEGYVFFGRDAKAVTELLALGEPEEILRRWRRAIAHQGFPSVRAIHELAKHWNHFTGPMPPAPKGAAWAQPGATDWSNRPLSFMEELGGEVPK